MDERNKETRFKENNEVVTLFGLKKQKKGTEWRSVFIQNDAHVCV